MTLYFEVTGVITFWGILLRFPAWMYCDDIILERLWEEKVKPYLDALILSRVTEEELRNVLKLGGDP